MREYIKKRAKVLLFGASFLLFVNLYFGFLCSTHVNPEDLLYLDLLVLVGAFAMTVWDFTCEKKNREKEASREEEWKIARCEREQLEEEIRELTDYVTRWVHEAKLPLASLKLMNERNQDLRLSSEMGDCLERIQQQLNTMMMSCKLENLENDVQFVKVDLESVVKEAMKNQAYFLIREHFQIEMNLKGIFVYGDRRWLVYLLDQLIGNAIKYRGADPKLSFGASKDQKEVTKFWVEDNGVGIEEEDLPYVFDKGYVGTNFRAGDYRSTGMGLYFVRKTCKRLGMEVEVCSEPGEGTRFTFQISNNASYFSLD